MSGIVPSFIVYDTRLCTKEEHDPAKALIYHLPKSTPTTDDRVWLCGQLVGAIQFCKSTFACPSVIKTKQGVAAVKRSDRFLMMMIGDSREWAESRLNRIVDLLNAATGGISSLWDQNGYDHSLFIHRLSSHLNSIIASSIREIQFYDNTFDSNSPSTSVSCELSPLSDAQDEVEKSSTLDKDSNGKKIDKLSFPTKEPRKTRFQIDSISERENEEETSATESSSALTELMYEMNSFPSVPLAKSGACAFLKAQQLLEVCQQLEGVFAGTILFQNRVLTTQVSSEINLVLCSLESAAHTEELRILSKKDVQFLLPQGVALSHFNLSGEEFSQIIGNTAKVYAQPIKKKCHNGLSHNQITSARSSHESKISDAPTSHISVINTSTEKSGPKKNLDPFSLCAKISRNADLLSDDRPSRSLPGTPRKLRISTMLPDVGSNSPGLRYKVLTTRRSKTGGVSSNNTPRKMSGLTNGVFIKGILNPPSLKRKEYINKLGEEKFITESEFWQDDKENIGIGIGCNDHSQNEVNIKNTRNKLNLNLAPEKINRPKDDFEEDEEKISKEINGNIIKDRNKGFNTSLKSKIIELQEDDDSSRSEASDISVLDLSSFLDSKENRNKLFAEATRKDSLKSDSSENSDSVNPDETSTKIETDWKSSDDVKKSNTWSKVVLYTQKLSQMNVLLFMDDSTAVDQATIYELYTTTSSALSEIEESLVKVLEMTEESVGDLFLRNTPSGLVTQEPSAISTSLIVDAHRCFFTNWGIDEIVLRDGENVIWGHRQDKMETFYQCSAPVRPGLPIPSDTMAKIPLRAKRRLEKDHGITIL